MVEKPETKQRGSNRKLQGLCIGAPSVTTNQGNDSRSSEQLMEAVVGQENMMTAYKRVKKNKGSAGVDGMRVEELQSYLETKWEVIKKALLEGNYQPKAVREVEITKPDGGMRKLGIPTVLDRLIGQAVHQVLEPIFDPRFSESSYGFRKGRSAHQALKQAKRYVSEGRNWVVDIDIEKYFDRVNHDVLMSRVARAVKDKRVLKLIRRYLQAGIMVDGLVTVRTEGTPQGSPLSPLLSNIMLDELDKELERRGHAFCRYADDCKIYVKSERAGMRVMESTTEFLKKRLRLNVNPRKSKVTRPSKSNYLGYSMIGRKNPRLRVSKKSEKRLKGKLREVFRRGRGRNIGKVITELNVILRGWANYFKLAEVKRVFEELDQWIRRRLRNIMWRQWKRSRTRAMKLMSRGIDEERAWRSAGNGRGPWWNSSASHMNEAFKKSYFERAGLFSLLDTIAITRNQPRTAVYGTVCTVV